MDDVSQIASRSPALRRLLQTLEQEGGMQSDVDRSYEMVAQDQEQSDSVESEAGSLGLLPVRPAQLRQLRFSRARLESTCARDPNRRALIRRALSRASLACNSSSRQLRRWMLLRRWTVLSRRGRQ